MDPARPGLVVATLVICVVSAQMGTSAVNVALPELAARNDGGFEYSQWTVLAYLLAMTATSLVVGYIGDVFGRVRTLQAGLLVFIAAGVVAAITPELKMLIAARAIQGIGAASMTALPLAIARDTVAPGRSGAVMGLLGTAAAVGTASGPAIGGILMGLWGWSAVFWATLPLPLVGCATIAKLNLREQTARPPGRHRKMAGHSALKGFDLLGSMIVACAVAVYAMAFTGAGIDVRRALCLLAVVAILVALLQPIERRAENPILPLGLLGSRALGIGAILNMIVGAVMMSTLVVGPFYLSGALGLSADSVGLVMAAGPVTSVCVGVFAGKLVDYGTPQILMTAGLSVMTLAAATLAVLPPLCGLPGYVAGTALLAPGYQLFMAANNTGALSAVAIERRGTAAGVLGLSRSLGLVTGTSVMAALFAGAVGSADVAAGSPAALGTGLRVVFGVCAALLAAASMASLSVHGPTRNRAA